MVVDILLDALELGQVLAQSRHAYMDVKIAAVVDGRVPENGAEPFKTFDLAFEISRLGIDLTAEAMDLA